MQELDNRTQEGGSMKKENPPIRLALGAREGSDGEWNPTHSHLGREARPARVARV